MKKKDITYILAFAGLWMLAATACTDETGMKMDGETEDAVQFTATLRTEEQLRSRAVGDGERGETEALPFVNGISIRKIQSSVDPVTVFPYNVKSANKGVLEYEGVAAEALKWNKDCLNESVDFFAWTTPTGVEIDKDSDEGTVDFVTGNTYTATPAEIKDKLNDAAVTPLEVFISAVSPANNYHINPSVMLPFAHQVSKLSISLRNWNAQHIDHDAATDITIEFLSIPNRWNVTQVTTGTGKAPFRLTQPANSSNLKLNFTDLYYDTNTGYFTLYLPPLIEALGTDFATAGDFSITYNTKQYFGTLASIPSLTELRAGRHIALEMDLSENYGVGVGADIVDWKGPDKEETIYANPNRGIYSVQSLARLADYLRSTDPAKELPDSLFMEESGQKIVRLYNDLTVSADLAVTVLGASLEGLVFDGQGHTITLPDGAGGLFGQAGASDASVTTEIKNLYLKGGAITAQGMLANTTQNVVITNCHVLEGSVRPATGDSGALIGTATTGTELHFCSSVAAVTGEGAIGGLVGTLSGTGVLLDGCYAQGIITGNGTSAGGLIGNMQAGSLTNCFFYLDGTEGKIEGTAMDKGALVGQAVGSGVTISQCYWATGVPGFPVVGGTAPSFSNCYSFSVSGNIIYPSITIAGKVCTTLIEALRAGTTGMNWVWVYGKDYPVVEKK